MAVHIFQGKKLYSVDCTVHVLILHFFRLAAQQATFRLMTFRLECYFPDFPFDPLASWLTAQENVPHSIHCCFL
jgi:hypothetical protein